MTALARVVRSGEVATYAVLTAVGLVAVVMGLGYGLTVEGGRVGPGLVPAVTGAGVAALAAGHLVKAGRRLLAAIPATADSSIALTPAGRAAAREAAGAEEERDLEGRTARQRVRQLWIVFGMLLATIFLVTPLGFVGAFCLFILAVSLLVERRPLLPSVAVAVGAAGVVHLVFAVLLGVPLPQGVLAYVLGG